MDSILSPEEPVKKLKKKKGVKSKPEPQPLELCPAEPSAFLDTAAIHKVELEPVLEETADKVANADALSSLDTQAQQIGIS